MDPTAYERYLEAALSAHADDELVFPAESHLITAIA